MAGRSRYSVGDRFWALVDQSGGPNVCWPFLGATEKRPRLGYGQFTLSVDGGQKTVRAHRVAYWLTHGSWPEDNGCHSCDNPSCCNPAHIFDATQRENVADMMAKGRRRLGIHHGGGIGSRKGGPYRKLTDDDVIEIRARSKTRESQNAIARSYNVSQACVWQIIHGHRRSAPGARPGPSRNQHVSSR